MSKLIVLLLLCVVVGWAQAQTGCMCGDKSGCNSGFRESGGCGGERPMCCPVLACARTSTTACGHAAGCFLQINSTVTTPVALRTAGCVNLVNSTSVPCATNCSDCVAAVAEWSACSSTCNNGGLQTRTRQVISPAVGFGSCNISLSESRSCNVAVPCIGSTAASSSITTATAVVATTRASSSSATSGVIGTLSSSSSSTPPGGLPEFTSSAAADGAAADGVTPADGTALTPTVIGLIAGGGACLLACGAALVAAFLVSKRRTATTAPAPSKPPRETKESKTPVYGPFVSARDEAPEAYGDLELQPQLRSETDLVGVSVYGEAPRVAEKEIVGTYTSVSAPPNNYTPAPAADSPKATMNW